MTDELLLSPQEIAICEFNSLRGRLCNVIESINLPKKQERAIITLIKNLSYQNQAVVRQLLEDLDSGKKYRYIDQKLQRVNNVV